MMIALAAPSARASDDRGTRSDDPVPASSSARVGSVPRGTALGSRAEEQSYAKREAASPDAKQFKGGSVIVIGATTVAIILLIVIILILI